MLLGATYGQNYYAEGCCHILDEFLIILIGIHFHFDECNMKIKENNYLEEKNNNKKNTIKCDVLRIYLY